MKTAVENAVRKQRNIVAADSAGAEGSQGKDGNGIYTRLYVSRSVVWNFQSALVWASGIWSLPQNCIVPVL